MKTIDENIKTQQYNHIYLLFGEEEYLKRTYKKKLLDAMVTEGDTMNFSTYEGKEINSGELIDLAETMPFFAERRVILVQDSNFFKSADDKFVKYIEESLENTSTYFIFVESEVDKRNKMYKMVQKKGHVAECIRQTDDVLQRWILGRIMKEGKQMTGAAYQTFISKVGNDMENINNELEKLLNYCMDVEGIEVEHVEAICIEQTTNKIFDMIAAIAQKNQTRALDLYYDLITLRESPMGILALIRRQFLQLLLISDLSAKGMDSRTMASKAGMPEFAVRKNLGMMKNFSIEQMREVIDYSMELEEDFKSGNISDNMIVELLIVKYSK